MALEKGRGVIPKDSQRLRYEDTIRRGLIVLTGLFILCASAWDLFAYTYTYHNRTGYGIRLTVELYDDANKTIHIDANGSGALTTGSLLKSWIAEAFLGDKWDQILNLTCDFLPGDHTFSIYHKEGENDKGEERQNWNVITDDVVKMNKR